MKLGNGFLSNATVLAMILCMIFFAPGYADECTTGVASGDATPDGRPLLWKSRDVTNANQEFHYVDLGDGYIPFIAVTYSGNTNDYNGGINAAGFALEDANSYNLPPGPVSNGWGSDKDDGEITKRALALCVTVDDFDSLLDSLNADGRTQNSNYGVIDAFGGAAMFETAGYSYTRYNAAEEAGYFLIRSNYSYSGNLDTTLVGVYRHDRAYSLWNAAVVGDSLTPQYVYRHVVRDLSSEVLDPYPLPFDGTYGGYPYGCVPNAQAICRTTTRSVLVVQGVPADGDPDDAVLWAMVAKPLATVALPLWVRAGSVPTEFNSDQGSRICDRGIELADWIYDQGAVNTWKLTNPEVNGFWDDIFPLEDWVFGQANDFANSEDFNNDALVETFQNGMAAQIADYLDAWQPDISPTTFEVPGDFTTIQEAINASRDGDTVLVHPGIYTGPLEFRGYNIVVGSLFLTTGDDSYIESTVIDCDGNGRSVAVFTNGENSNTLLTGFTLQNANTNYGGGVYCNGASPTLDHLLIRNCETEFNGGGVYATHSSNPAISHVTIVANVANVGGGIHTYDNSAPTITNSIIWNNDPPAIPVSVSISYSDVEGAGGGTNIDADPLFVDPVNADYHLSWLNFPLQDDTRSPCIDSGDPNSPHDPDGTRVDQGVFYFDQNQEAGPVWTDVPESISANEGDPIAFTVTGMDPDGDPLSITLDPDGIPDGYVFTDHPPDGTADFSWQTAEGDAGDYTATFTISDGSLTDVAVVPIHVSSGPEPETCYAGSEETIRGTVQGNYTNTTASDDSYEILTERESGGKPVNRHSLLEHIWTFQFSGYDLVLHAEAYRSANEEGDNFLLAGSFDGQNYTDLITVTKTTDDDAEQIAVIIGDATGTYYVRVTDTDHTSGNRVLDSFYIDRLYISYMTGDVPNRAPIWTDVPELVSEYAGDMIQFTVTGADPDDDNLNISLATDVPDGYNFTDNGDGTASFSWETVANDVGDYTATFTISDGELTDEAPVPISVIEAPEPGTMIVSAIDLSENVINKNFTTCVGVLTVLDLSDAAVEGVLVSATWSGLYSANVQGTTDEYGQVTFETEYVRRPNGYFTLTVTDVSKDGWTYDFNNVNNVTEAELGVGDAAGGDDLTLRYEEPIPEMVMLNPAYPNPFNARTVIRFGLPEDGRVRLAVYNPRGRLVEILINRYAQAGWHSAIWAPELLANGEYFLRLESGEFVKVRSLVLLR